MQENTVFLSIHISFLALWLPTDSPDLELSHFWRITKSSFTTGTDSIVPVQENRVSVPVEAQEQHVTAQ